LNFFGLLCFVRVLAAFVNKYIGLQFCAQLVFRQHTFYSVLQYFCRIFVQQLSWGRKSLSARVACITHIFFIGKLFTGKLYLFGIDDNHIISAIYVWSKGCLMFTSKYFGNL